MLSLMMFCLLAQDEPDPPEPPAVVERLQEPATFEPVTCEVVTAESVSDEDGADDEGSGDDGEKRVKIVVDGQALGDGEIIKESTVVVRSDSDEPVLRRFRAVFPGEGVDSKEQVQWLQGNGAGLTLVDAGGVPARFPGLLTPPTAPTGPFSGTLELTAEDGTITTYKAKFTPDAPETAEAPPKAWLGVTLSAREPQGDPAGLVIDTVLPEGPAAKSGLKDGDRVISINGEALASFPMLREKVAGAAEGKKALTLKIVRDKDEDGEALLQLEITPEPFEPKEKPAVRVLPGLMEKIDEAQATEPGRRTFVGRLPGGLSLNAGGAINPGQSLAVGPL
ncbi:MAG: PDZ domain-containing protein, partial [Planctomycetota bacterium]